MKLFDMEHLGCSLLIFAVLLSSCAVPTSEVTPTPEPTPIEVVTPTPTPVPAETSAPGAMTEEEIRWFEEEFFRSQLTNIRNVFGSPYGCTYATPRDINLAQLFSDGYLDRASDDEVRELISRDAFGGVSDDQEGYPCPIYRMTREEMSDVLLKYTGLSLEETNQVGLDHLPYLKEHDAYYWCIGDEGYPGPLTILSGAREGNTVKLYQRGWGDVLYCLTLEQQPEGNYWFVSNLPVAEEEGIDP